jgi:hypothetical protein
MEVSILLLSLFAFVGAIPCFIFATFVFASKFDAYKLFKFTTNLKVGGHSKP